MYRKIKENLLVVVLVRYYGQFIININKRSMKEKVPEGKTKTTQRTKEKEGQGFDAVKYETL